MKKLNTILLCAGLALAMAACKNETTDNTTATDTMASATDTASTMATDTSSTMTTDTSSTMATNTAATSTMSSDDTAFMNKAAQGGMGEVTLGQMVSPKATNADVKAFADRMVADHSKANDELKQLAQTKGVTLPADPDPASKEVADKLTKASGKEVDKLYIDDMVKDHEKDVKEFEKASKEAKDPDLKAWAAKTLPTLQDHLKMAKAAKAKVK